MITDNDKYYEETKPAEVMETNEWREWGIANYNRLNGQGRLH